MAAVTRGAGPTDDPITIAIAGDTMLGRLVAPVIADRGYAYPWGDMLPTLREADLFLINQEFALTASAERWRDASGREKAFYFRADPSAVNALQEAGVDLASLANNHALDFGARGLLDTVRVLDAAGIAHAGAGASLTAARKPTIVSARGLRVAVVSWSDHPEEWAAREEAPGINYTPVSTARGDFTVIQDTLDAARQQADFVIFSIHWGPNMRTRPPGGFKKFARAVVDAGADLFWGHSAHVIQGIEVHNGKPILYDTGDFVDDYAVDTDLRNDLSALFLLRVSPAGVESVDLLPVRIDDMQVNRARGRDREWIIGRFQELSGEFGTELTVTPEGLSVTSLGKR
ncbi:MAG: CapA family protein [Dehalococcoidia bacterium]